MKNKELVTLRQRAMSNGGQSLYLDYSIDGIRHRDNLNMYLVPERTRIDKLQNQETLKQAQAAKAAKILAIQSGDLESTTRKKDMLVADYLQQRETYYYEKDKGGYSHCVHALRQWLVKSGCRMTLKSATKSQIEDLFRFIGKHKEVSALTLYNYFCILNTQFRAAVREGIIKHNVFQEFAPHERPKKPETEREYLTLEELRKLAKTRIRNNTVRQMFLFACYTGLRISDARALTWDKIRKTDTGMQVGLTQQKTKRLVYVPLAPTALSFLPERIHGKNNLVWPDVPAPCSMNTDIVKWVKRAGINKHITFHCARHTNATLLLTNGADLYTVSKLLGHTKITTTQIYAKIIDQKKVDAVNAIPEL